MLAKLTFGRLFGETGLLNDNPRNASIITIENSEFMVFHKKALDLIKIFYSNDFSERKNYMIKMIPELGVINNQLRVTQIIEFFKPAHFKCGSMLTLENAKNNKVFLIEEGEVVLSKIISMPLVHRNHKVRYKDKEIAITTIQGTGIIGEECLDGDGRYKYTATVKSSDVKAFVFERANNVTDFQSFPLYGILLKGYNTKE